MDLSRLVAGLTPGSSWARTLCDAFGEDPDQVMKLVLTLAVNKPVQLEVTRFIKPSETDVPLVIDTIGKTAWLVDIGEPKNSNLTPPALKEAMSFLTDPQRRIIELRRGWVGGKGQMTLTDVADELTKEYNLQIDRDWVRTQEQDAMMKVGYTYIWEDI